MAEHLLSPGTKTSWQLLCWISKAVALIALKGQRKLVIVSGCILRVRKCKWCEKCHRVTSESWWRGIIIETCDAVQNRENSSLGGIIYSGFLVWEAASLHHDSGKNVLERSSLHHCVGKGQPPTTSFYWHSPAPKVPITSKISAANQVSSFKQMSPWDTLHIEAVSDTLLWEFRFCSGLSGSSAQMRRLEAVFLGGQLWLQPAFWFVPLYAF